MFLLLIHFAWLPARSLQCLSSHFGCGIDLFTSTDVHHLYLLQNTALWHQFAKKKAYIVYIGPTVMLVLPGHNVFTASTSSAPKVVLASDYHWGHVLV